MASSRICLRFGPVFMLAALLALSTPAAPFTGSLLVTGQNVGELYLTARDGVWEPVTTSDSRCTFVNVGFVASAQTTADTLKLTIHLKMDKPKLGAGLLDLDLRRKGDAWSGMCTSTVGANASTQPATAIVLPETRRRSEPARGNEHPRLLLRKSQVPALRAKMQTPLGEAFLARGQESDHPVVLGVLYQATGDTQYADAALRKIRGLKDIDSNSLAGTGEIGHQIVRVALTYDLCYDVWPKEFCEQLRRQIRARMPKRQRDLLFGHANYSPASNYYGPGFGSAAIATLLLHEEKGQEPQRPVPPLCVNSPDCTIPPAAGFEVPRGVPVVELREETMPDDWIYVGGLLPPEGEEPIDSLGGLADARPTPGVRVTDGTRTETFRSVSREKDKGYWEWTGEKVISVTAANGRVYYSTNYFYTVLNNTTPRLVTYSNMAQWHNAAHTYLNGVPIEEGQVVRLEKGLYPILVKVVMGQTEPWGQELISPQFETITEEKAKPINDRYAAQYELALQAWETDRANWERLGKADLQSLRMVHKGRHQVVRHLRRGIGNGGFQAEVSEYGNIAAYYPLLYAVCHLHTFGRHASPWPDATHVLPRKMMQAFFAGEDKAIIMQLNNKSRFEPRWCANYFPLVPDEWKPAILWGWNHVCGVSIERARDLDRAAADKIMARHKDLYLATAFVNYPLDMDPVHPADCMPKTWTADTFGHYVFRNGWQGRDQCIAQVFTKSTTIGGWNHPNAGAFRLWGLGHPWTSQPIERSGYRDEESVVILPEEAMHEGACGVVTHYEAQADGSGCLSLDLADVYMAAKRPKPKKKDPILDADMDDVLGGVSLDGELLPTTEKMVGPKRMREAVEWERIQARRKLRKTLPRLYDSWGHRRADVAHKSHVTGWRAMGFDYSGASGAPCLMVLVDSVRGGSGKTWLWQLPTARGYKVEIDGNTVNIIRPDASLTMTFVSPAGVAPVYKKDWVRTYLYKGGSKKGDTINRYYDVIMADSRAKDVDYVVAVTLQRGSAPPVKAKGEGLSAEIAVGARAVRCDDRRIVFGR